LRTNDELISPGFRRTSPSCRLATHREIEAGKVGKSRVSDVPPIDAKPKRYALLFLTDQWEWDAELAADTFEVAKAASRAALERLVEDEKPELACVTLLEAGVKVGVWDWVAAKAHWTPL
jgi:hypothetical protein